MTVITAIKMLKGQLTDLDDVVTAFVQGARDTFVERFSDEFKDGSGIDKLTERELETLYFSSTNDANEGRLGSWQHGQARRPAETLLKFNASFIATRNNTESFISYKLTEEEDHAYLIRTARKRDASGHQKALKIAQIQADEEKITQNWKKEAEREERHENKATALIETVKNLVLTTVEIEGLKNGELDLQLDCHRASEIEEGRVQEVSDPPIAAVRSTHDKA
jgi:hypothetical protein